ncbi:MAG: HepT-like ribonuclease domain-containing protein, partial [Candidatus Acidiferrales bacterium]
GEALAQLAKLDVKLAGRISQHRRIIAFRNILIHGYANVDDRLVWDVVETKLPILRREVETLLSEE